jgi:hypothetical protein
MSVITDAPRNGYNQLKAYQVPILYEAGGFDSVYVAMDSLSGKIRTIHASKTHYLCNALLCVYNSSKRETTYD